MNRRGFLLGAAAAPLVAAIAPAIASAVGPAITQNGRVIGRVTGVDFGRDDASALYWVSANGTVFCFVGTTEPPWRSAPLELAWHE